MDRFPIFHKEAHALDQEDLMKNIWCPHYDDCLDVAARKDLLMDCSGCAHSQINYEKYWRYYRIYDRL